MTNLRICMILKVFHWWLAETANYFGKWLAIKQLWSENGQRPAVIFKSGLGIDSLHVHTYSLTLKIAKFNTTTPPPPPPPCIHVIFQGVTSIQNNYIDDPKVSFIEILQQYFCCMSSSYQDHS